MAMDATTEQFVKNLAENGGPAFHELPVDKCREVYKELVIQLSGELADIGDIKEISIPGGNGQITLRVYTPKNKTNKMAGVAYFHGGGWVIGDLDTHDPVCRRLCQKSDCVFFSVDYRLAPEHKYPAGIDDCITATQWIYDNAAELGVDPKRIGVAGDSAGGNMAAVVAQELKNVVAYQLLMCPAVDLSDKSYPSREEYGQGEYLLSMKDMVWFGGHLATELEELLEPKASPISNNNLSGLPPALTVTAGCDPLCDEGKAYADKLSEAGVDSEYKCYEGTVHNFYQFPAVLETGLEGLDFMAARLKDRL
ncbi:MAG: alpha/beta hydrolase [Pseudomonadota bacterium]|nr:alpha/beta hydrolase [Pseudomonadota bacterium]